MDFSWSQSFNSHHEAKGQVTYWRGTGEKPVTEVLRRIVGMFNQQELL